MRKSIPGQIEFAFVIEMKAAADRERKKKEESTRRANETARMKELMKRYPVTEYEFRVVPKGVRISRFVSSLECEKCKYNTSDHSLNNRFGIDRNSKGWDSVVTICLKDWYEKKH